MVDELNSHSTRNHVTINTRLHPFHGHYSQLLECSCCIWNMFAFASNLGGSHQKSLGIGACGGL